MVDEFKNCYKNYRLIDPKRPTHKVLLLCILSFATFFRQRIEYFYLFKTNKCYFKFHMEGSEIIEEIYKKTGAIFITIHSGSYPMIFKILGEKFSTRNIVVPFNYHRKVSVFNLFKKHFIIWGIEIVRLGDAMPKIDQILSGGGSAILFIDTEIPINDKYKQKVKMFATSVNMTTGPVYLAKKYSLPIVPICVIHNKRKLTLKVFAPVNCGLKRDDEIMNELAESVEKMVGLSLGRWQPYDKFLFS